MENQLEPFVEQLEEFGNWVISMINAKYNKDFCNVKLVPFRLADDIMNKQILLNSQGNSVSKTTVQESLNLDPEQERKRLIEETIQSHEDQKEIEQKMRDKEQNMAEQSKNEEQANESGDLPQYNQQKLIARAAELAQQLIAVPYEQRKSYLAQLQNEDYIMWAIVGKQLESLHQDEKKSNGPNK